MDTNFEEKQAFEDLRGVLANIYQFANHYYAEMKTAQSLNAEKDSAIEHLNEKISALEDKILEQEKLFTAHLKDNITLAQQLENFQSDLKKRKEKLDARAEELQNTTESLKSKYAALVRERADFDAEKKSHAEKLSNYEALQARAENFDAEKQTLQNRIKELEQTQPAIDTSQEEIDQLKLDNTNLQTKIKNLEAQLEQNKTSEDNPQERILQLEQDKDYWKNKYENLLRDNGENPPAKNSNDENNSDEGKY